uniref:Putative F-box/kelch-repeat protein n=1 Tax=Noccaea caerulescens TaxID=107243 RepID=A0A1J3CWW3_NOCCA
MESSTTRALIHPLSLQEQMMISDIFQCDGLFSCTTKDKRIVVWNPCSGQTRWIRIQPRNGNLNLRFVCSSFKILRYRRHNNNYLRLWVNEFEMYDFNSDSWRRVDEDTRSNSTVDQRNKKWMITSRGVSLKGNAFDSCSGLISKERDLNVFLFRLVITECVSLSC